MENLVEIAKEIRKDVISMIHGAGSGHPGGSLSCADILAVLYFNELRVNPLEPAWPQRDRFILSKGHACPALYAAISRKGFFPKDECRKLRRLGSLLEGHPDVKTPGIEAPSGSLGMGLSQGLGVALAARYTKQRFRTYVLLGDGDMEEGNTWEAIMACGHFALNNIIAILDANGLQGEDTVSKQMDYFPIIDKIKAFKWSTIEIDGNNVSEVVTAFSEAKSVKNKPAFILANTVKGKGVSFMEHSAYWHGSVKMTDEQKRNALIELEG